MIEVPKNAHSFRDKLSYEGGYWLVMFEPRIEPYLAIQSIRVEGNSFCNFKIINTISNLTEEECKELVDFIPNRHSDYNLYKNYITEGFIFGSSKQSFISLLKSKNILAKSFVEKPIYFTTENSNLQSVKWEDFMGEYQNLPDELLLIQINN